MNQSQAIISRAKTLIEKGWCQGKLAKDSNGNSVDHLSEFAESFCLIGALARASHEQKGYSIYQELCFKIFNKINKDFAGRWNDTHSKDDVLNLLDSLYKDEENGQCDNSTNTN